MSGEWWRCVTALTLHADGLHLLANVVFMLAVGQAVIHVFGRGLGVALMVGGGTLGNGLAAWVSGGGQTGVGASTMGFAALGVMSLHQSIMAFKRWRRWAAVWRRAWLPLASGLALLGVMGTGPRSDLAGHAFGFIAGILLALPFSLPAKPPALSKWVQWLLTLLSGSVVVLAWLCAWMASR
jgi:membrane associated rhomboid family serine protease